MSNATSLSAADQRMLVLAWQCLESNPKVDYTKLAAIGGYKNAQSASACFNPVRKRVLALAAQFAPNSDGTNNNTATTSNTAKASPANTKNISTKKPTANNNATRGKKRSAGAVFAGPDDDGDDDGDRSGDAVAVAAGTGRRGRAKRTKLTPIAEVKEEDEEEGDGEAEDGKAAIEVAQACDDEDDEQQDILNAWPHDGMPEF